MKILQLVQKPQLRGAEIFASHLCKHLMEQGEEVLLVTIFQGDATLPFDGPTVHLNARYRNRFWDLLSWYRFYLLLKREKPDLVQANSGFTLKFAVFSRLFFRWKQPLIFRNASTISRYIHSETARRFNKIFLDQCVSIASVSDHSMRDMLSMFPSVKGRIVKIPTGIEEFRFQEVRKDDRFYTIVHIGGFTFEKNHHELIEIFSKVLQHIPNARLWLIGEGPLRSEIEEKVRLMALQSSVSFIGYTKEVDSYLMAADLLVSTSVIEGMPAAILEAFYCKVPVVSYEAGGIGEIITDGITGRLIKQGDDEAFLSAVQAMYHNDNRSFIDNAYQRVVTFYMNKKVAAGFRQLYEEILQYRTKLILALPHK